MQNINQTTNTPQQTPDDDVKIIDPSKVVAYGTITLADLVREIHVNQKVKNTQIEQLIATLSTLIKNVNDASIVVPLIKEYLEVAVKNDEQLVKIAGIVQKLISNIRPQKVTQQNGKHIDSDAPILSKEEIEQIMKDIESLKTTDEPVIVGTKKLEDIIKS